MRNDTFSFRSMSTNVEVQITFAAIEENKFDTSVQMEHVRSAVQSMFDQVEQSCSRFIENSELMLLNTAKLSPMPVSGLLFRILHQAQKAYLDTNGIFNPGIYQQLRAAGYVHSIEDQLNWEKTLRELHLQASSSQAQPITAFPYTLDHSKQMVARMENMSIDLGGIAKGWTVDYVAAYLESLGTGYVNAGGDLRLFGNHSKPLAIGVEDPFDISKLIGTVQIRSGAIATSSIAKRKWQVGEQQMNHLINPQTGKPVLGSITACTVHAPTAVEADVWAKTILILGPKQGQATAIKQGLKTVWVEQDGTVRSV